MSATLYVVDQTKEGCPNLRYYTHLGEFSPDLFRLLGDTICEKYGACNHEMMDAKLCQAVGFERCRFPSDASIETIIQLFDEVYLFTPSEGLLVLKDAKMCVGGENDICCIRT